MSVFLKKFGTHTEYEAYIASEDKVLPNVSFCEDVRDVHFNSTLPETRVVAVYIPEEVGAEVKLFGLNFVYDEPPFSMMEVNGVLQEEVQSTLSVSGETEYVVKYTFKEGESQLDENLFQYCPNLTSMVIPNSVTSIGERAFADCYGLTSVTIPNSVTSIGINAFSYCDSLTSVTIPNGVTSIGESTFQQCTNMTSVTIPNSVTIIGSAAFANCQSLTSVTIPNSVTSIGDYAFRGCSSLTSVAIGNSVTNIGERAFYDCSNLTSVTIGNSVTSISSSAFTACYALTNVIIPNSVTNIGGRAFYDCSNLESITVEAAEPPILDDGDVFDSTNDCPIYVPSESVEIYKEASMWDEYADRIQAIP